MAKKGNKYIGCNVKSATFISFYRAAVRRGEHPADLLREWVEERLEVELEDQKAKDPMLMTKENRMFLLEMQHAERLETRAQLKRFAYTAFKTKKEEDMELFHDACEVMEVDPDDVMNEISGYQVPPDDNAGEPTGVISAADWLTSFIPIGSAMPSNEVLTTGKQMGYSKDTLETVKRQLGIISTRKSAGWVWTWPEKVSGVQ